MVIYVAKHTFNIISVKTFVVVILNVIMYTCKEIPLIGM